MAQSYKIALSNFYTCNPAIKSDHSGLEGGYYVCVEIRRARLRTDSILGMEAIVGGRGVCCIQDMSTSFGSSIPSAQVFHDVFYKVQGHTTLLLLMLSAMLTAIPAQY